ncbi:MAG TPA: hypothetical protein VKS21_00675, partial [Spirochaetota bacterium]|nr:hypothetical protein [Spirochaetota bacterium]
GSIIKDALNSLQAGFAVKNIGFSSSFNGRDTKIPAGYSAGLSYTHKFRDMVKLTAAADLQQIFKEEVQGCLGLETAIFGFLLLRAGYTITSSKYGISAGMGITTGDWQLQYAFKQKEAGFINTVTVKFIPGSGTDPGWSSREKDSSGNETSDDLNIDDIELDIENDLEIEIDDVRLDDLPDTDTAQKENHD